MSAPLPTEKIPRLVSDTARSMIAVAVTIPLSLVLGFVVGLLTSPSGGLSFVGLQIGLVLAVVATYFVLYQILTLWTFRRASRAQLRRWLPRTEPRRRGARLAHWLSGGGATSWSTSAAVLSLVAIVAIAFRPELRAESLIVITAAVLVVTSWFMIPVTYAVQYARAEVVDGGLEFPGDEEPVFGDYLYLALQISTTYSGSDVAVTNRAMRNRVSVHSVVAFVFNSVIIALLVSALLITAT